MRQPAWKVVNALFERHSLEPPPVRLRDELVGWYIAYEAARDMGSRVAAPERTEVPGDHKP